MSERLTLRIVRLGFRGDGLGVPVDDPSGRAVRVAHTVPGDVVEVSPLELEHGPARARLERLLEAGPQRVGPHCPQHVRCSGCQLRVLAPTARLAHILRGWQRALRRATGLSLEALDAITAAPVCPAPHDGYRTRASVALAVDAASALIAGMPSRDRTAAPLEVGVIDLVRCPAQHPRSRQALAVALDAVRAALDAAPCEPGTTLGRLTVEVGLACGDVRVVLQPEVEPVLERAADLLAEREPGWSIVISADEMLRRVSGDGRLRVAGPAGELLEAPLGAWTSPTPYGAAAVAEVIFAELDRLRPPGEPWQGAIELGCGLGTHAGQLAARATRYVGVDGTREAIAAAQANLHAVANAEARLGRASHALKRLLSGGLLAELLIIHPMRRGIGAEVGRYLRPLGATTVLHVAPSARALADDAPMLLEAGFRLERLVPVDTMPHTYHLMAVTVWRR